MAASKKSNVEVAIRIRPMRSELNESKSAWEVTGKSLMELQAENETTFTFDRVYGPDSVNGTVYEKSVQSSIVQNVCNGYNGTVFAYGQTGSGKSHTMLGDQAEAQGVTGMAIDDLFAGLEKDKAKGTKVRVFLEMLEIYNEQLRDLLVKREAQGQLSIRENEHGVYVHNATRKTVTSAAHCMSAMSNEAEARVVAATAMNSQSSRSHCLIRIIVEKTTIFDDSDDDTTDTDIDPSSPASSNPQAAALGRKKTLEKKVVASLNLVDLAGSERVAKTGATGQRMVEGGHINKSLTTLTTVIHKLSEPVKPGQHRHIPFRDSKLTNLLKTALGGNSFTTVFCCITVARQHVDESRSTLMFAQRAKTIRNEIHVNEVMDNKARLRELEIEVRRLRKVAVATDIYLWSKELRIRNLKNGVEGQNGSIAQGAATGCSGALASVGAEHVERLEALVQQLTDENALLREEAERAGAALADMEAAGGGGHIDPMTGLPINETALREDLEDSKKELEAAVSDRQSLTEGLAEVEKMCDELERELEEKDKSLSAATKKCKVTETELQATKAELEAVVGQLAQIQERKRADDDRRLAQARGDELLEALTQQQIDHEALQLEHNTLLDMFSRIEIESAATKQQLNDEVCALEQRLEEQRTEQMEMRAAVWRFISISHQATHGEQMKSDEVKLSAPVKPHHVEHALKSLSLFVASRRDRPPNTHAHAPSSAGATPSKSLGPVAVAHVADSMGGGDLSSTAVLEKRVKELEASIQTKDAQRDVIIDTKLKRMQELVMRLHTTNRCLLSDIHKLAEENNAMHDIIRKESKLYKHAARDGLQPVSEELLKNRALFTQVPAPPHHHN